MRNFAKQVEVHNIKVKLGSPLPDDNQVQPSQELASLRSRCVAHVPNLQDKSRLLTRLRELNLPPEVSDDCIRRNEIYRATAKSTTGHSRSRNTPRDMLCDVSDASHSVPCGTDLIVVSQACMGLA